MAGRFQYHKVMKYLVTATCTEPLHIGSSTGEKEEVLIHPVDNVPFLQASGIAGVFRRYYEKQNGSEAAEKLFGSIRANEMIDEQESKIRFSDGTFEQVVLERRPRVAINRDSGTCDTSMIQGTDRTAGHRFTMEYIGAGAKVNFAVYLYAEEQKNILERVFAAMHMGALQLGGQKSNGCGCLSIDSLYCRSFDFTKAEDRAAWAEEDTFPNDAYENITNKLGECTAAVDGYEITVYGKTEGALLVKSMATEFSEEDTSYSENIRNAKKEYIVPGSSFKGAVRSQMERIATYLSKPTIIDFAFGKKASKNEKGTVGCLYFYDTKIGEKTENDMVKPTRRIHIDKLTGGVFEGGLFAERNVFGNMEFRVAIKESPNKECVCGVLLMALRDLAIGTMSVGGGYNVGKGFIAVSKIRVKDLATKEEATFDFSTGTVTDDFGMISRCMMAVNRTEEG